MSKDCTLFLGLFFIGPGLRGWGILWWQFHSDRAWCKDMEFQPSIHISLQCSTVFTSHCRWSCQQHLEGRWSHVNQLWTKCQKHVIMTTIAGKSWLMSVRRMHFNAIGAFKVVLTGSHGYFFQSSSFAVETDRRDPLEWFRLYLFKPQFFSVGTV